MADRGGTLREPAVREGHSAQRPLRDCALFLSGGTPSKSEPAYWGGSIPWLSAKDMKSFVVYDTEDHLTEVGARSGTKMLEADGLLILTRGMTLLHDVPICIAGRAMTFNQDVKGILPKAGVDGRYLAYAIISGKPQLLASVELAGHGTGRLPTDRLAELPIWLPSIHEQAAIAAVLGALDDKIELNRRMNETLEEMARALFKSWFVDFDPVHAKAAGKKPYGMDEATAALFPNGFSSGRSELGTLPQGWGITSVSRQSEAVYDGPHATPAPADKGPVFLGIRNLKPLGLDLAELRRISEDDWPRWTKRVVPREGDIVFSYEATLGYFALIPPGLRCCLGRRLALVRPFSKPANGHYLLHYFTSDPFQTYLQRHLSVGATVDRILLADFPSYPVLDPGNQLIHAFEEQASTMWQTLHARARDSEVLAQFRDTLLPKLLSGELRIRDAEKLVGEAT